MNRKATFPIFLVCVFVLLAGCGAAPQIVRPEFKSSDTFVVGMEQKKSIGEPMVDKVALHYYPGFVAKNDYLPPGMLGTQFPLVKSGSEWSCQGRYEGGNYRCKAVLGWGRARALGVEQNFEYDLVITPSGNPSGVVAGDIYGINSFPDPQPVVFRPSEIAQPGSFRQELLYNGKSKDTIRISYREFKDTLARPAFSQDLSYDLSESREIGFRGMIIEVVEATNSYIRFLVRKPMSQ
jgi:hypothetical protein